MYDTVRLQQAFGDSGETLAAIAAKAGVGISTVHRIISFGVGRPANVDAVARALGFKRGRKDVLQHAPQRADMPKPLTSTAQKELLELARTKRA